MDRRAATLECPEGRPVMLAWTLRTVLLTLLVAGAVVFAVSPGGLLQHLLDREPSAAANTVPPAARHPVQTPNELIYRRDRDGHFYVDADVNGTRIRFLIDTGATLVALSPDDARSAGLRISGSDYTARSGTANGVTRVAPVTLREVGLEQLQVFDVRAVVLEQPMRVSLLGMSFLSRLQSYEMRNDELVLRW
jgi:aspartyl protease family protein